MSSHWKRHAVVYLGLVIKIFGVACKEAGANGGGAQRGSGGDLAKTLCKATRIAPECSGVDTVEECKCHYTRMSL